MSNNSENQFEISEDNELRVGVDGGNHMKLILLSGSAEILGTQLSLNRVYQFQPVVQSVYPIHTWNGCVVQIIYENEPSTPPCLTEKSPMPMYLNSHICLEKLRLKGKSGPIVMVTGKKYSGKNSLCKILCNYAVRDDRSPVLVDVDVSQSMLSIPGTIGATVVNQQIPLDNEEMTNFSPLVYNFGSIDNAESVTFFKLLISELGSQVDAIKANNTKVNTSGVIINTGCWVAKAGYQLLLHAAQIFHVDVIIVLSNEQLYNDFNKDLPLVKTIFLPKSDGIVDLPSTERMMLRKNKVRRYFYGSLNKPFRPHTLQFSFNKIKIFKVSDQRHVPVAPNLKMKNCLLALSTSSHDRDLQCLPIAGYVCVMSVEEDQKTLTLLSPQPQLLPKSLFILTELTFTM